jgi:hypothetical protein
VEWACHSGVAQCGAELTGVANVELVILLPLLTRCQTLFKMLLPFLCRRHAVAYLLKASCYKPVGRGFDSGYH